MAKREKTYDKPAALKAIFERKFDPQQPQTLIRFSRDEVALAIRETGNATPYNLNNFVKDLVRTGNHDPRVEAARERGYGLRESLEAPRVLGEFYLHANEPPSAIVPSAGLTAVSVPNGFAAAIDDVVRGDEGGLIAAIQACGLLQLLFSTDPATDVIYLVQSPVKIQPNEIDGLWLLERHQPEGVERILIPVEGKHGRDVIAMSQVVGNTRAALRIASGNVSTVWAVGAKLNTDNSVYLVALQPVSVGQEDQVAAIVRGDDKRIEGLYRITPVPQGWQHQAVPDDPATPGQLPLLEASPDSQ